MFRINL